MRYRFYNTSQKAWKGMFAAIRSAKKSIYLEMYVFQNDIKGLDFLSTLEQKALGGVRVIVVLDALGSAGFTSGEAARLRAAGAEVLFFSYWFRRLHRKILIIDEHTVFTGGVNILRRYAPWNDLQVRVSGKRIVSLATRSFARVYGLCGGKDIELLKKGNNKILSFKKVRMWFLEHGVLGKRAELKRHYEDHIAAAKESIILVTPYFVPRRWLIACLHGAILRGVRVEIIIPASTDRWGVDPLNYYYLSLFTKLGALGYLFQEMNHAKVMLVDGKMGTVGSQNLDTLSFDWNAEAGLVFDGPAMTRDLGKILDDWRIESVLFTPNMRGSRWYDALLYFIGRWF